MVKLQFSNFHFLVNGKGKMYRVAKGLTHFMAQKGFIVDKTICPVKTQGVEPMFFQCLPIVYDAGQTLKNIGSTDRRLVFAGWENLHSHPHIKCSAKPNGSNQVTAYFSNNWAVTAFWLFIAAPFINKMAGNRQFWILYKFAKKKYCTCIKDNRLCCFSCL